MILELSILKKNDKQDLYYIKKLKDIIFYIDIFWHDSDLDENSFNNDDDSSYSDKFYS